MELVMVGEEVLDMELYIETYFQEVLEACIGYGEHLQLLFTDGIGDSSIKHTIFELFYPIAAFYGYYLQGKEGFTKTTIIQGVMKEFVTYVESSDTLVY